MYIYFNLHKLTRNCKQLVHTCHKWHMFGSVTSMDE